MKGLVEMITQEEVIIHKRIHRARFNILCTARHTQEDMRSRSAVAEESPSDTPRAHYTIHRS